MSRSAVSTVLRNLVSEAHPHGRYPTTVPMHSVDYFRLLTRFGRTASWYVPAVLVLLGWPLYTAAIIQKSNTGHYWTYVENKPKQQPKNVPPRGPLRDLREWVSGKDFADFAQV